MTGTSDWQGGVGRAWAEEWQRTDRSFCALTPVLLAAIAAQPGARILDIGCGAGELSLAVAQARPAAQVRGIDVSADLVEAARQRGQGCANARFDLADAGAWSDPAFVPDLLVSRHGVMFFADPPAAFRQLAASAAPGARLVFSCFRAPAHNAWASTMAGLAPPPASLPDPRAPGPFAFADPDHVRTMLAGWTDLAFTPHDFRYRAGEGADAEAQALALFRRIGPAASALRQAAEADRAGIEHRLRQVIAAHHRNDEVSFAAAAWIVTATKA
ncbi:MULTISPECIES: class I SAM-dependent methyltransferase [unclassified Sphingomonas]|uniref:class I SAM-dependent methyltransferase n=1 Tax=Novosphingobium rhizosphaerae TaxID=1551649 RepID=UPI0015C81A10